MITSKIIRFLSTAALVVGFTTVAHAQATRTWVSGVGDDANPCSRTAPCKTFAGAISKTAPCGEISVLDPGGFGAVTITKAITLNGTGTLAGILSALANAAVIVNAGANDTVVLRHISMNGACSGVNGVRFIAGKNLVIDTCWIGNMTTRGIDVAKTADGTHLKVFNTDITNVNTAIGASTTVGAVFVDVDNVTTQATVNGINYVSNASGTVLDSYFSRNVGGTAVSAGSGCIVNIIDCHFRSNSTAINAAVGSVVRINENEIFDNTNGLAGNAASFQSGGNNKLAGNGASVTPTGAALTNQ
jgi:hypothetical protein